MGSTFFASMIKMLAFEGNQSRSDTEATKSTETYVFLFKGVAII